MRSRLLINGYYKASLGEAIGVINESVFGM